MSKNELTKADLKLWEEYTKGITSINSHDNTHVYKTPQPIKLSDYVNTIKDIPEHQKSKKNRKPYEAILDLHGMTRNEAHTALERFLCREKLRGSKCVLVITGKGHGKGGDGSGILKRKVPLWLEVSKIARSWSIAARHHGGEGALYVYL